LGTYPQHAESLRVVLDDGLESEQRRVSTDYDATKDFSKIEFCHVGGDRYLWRATFVAVPRLDDTVFHLYVDADADGATGRQGPEGAAGTGTECMLSAVGGRETSSFYDPDGNRTNGPPVTHVVAGNPLLVSTDIELGRDDRGVRFALYVLCHASTQPGSNSRMSDASGKRIVENVPLMSHRDGMRGGRRGVNRVLVVAVCDVHIKGNIPGGKAN